MDEKDELIELRNKLIETERQLQEKCEENTQLKELNNVLSNKGANSSKGQYAKVLDEMYRLCLSDADEVISLIRNKTINVVDVDSKGKTLLLIASAAGSYQIVNLCLNLGADITHKDSKNHDAIYWAQQGAWSHVEQLLLFHKMDANVGNRVKNTAQYIKKQQGIIENISKALSSYDSSTQQFFKDTVIDLMTNLISNKLSFSDDLLNLCWEFESKNIASDGHPLSSKLWTSLLKTCGDIIQNGNKRDWHWVKTFILPSAIWLKKDNDNDQMYLYFKLVKLVEQQANEQLNELQENLDILAKKNQSDWDELTTFDGPDQDGVVRQDTVADGIAPKFTFSQLSEENASSATFNSHFWYDYNEYLPELLLQAHIVDDEFQKSIQKVFNIEKSSNTAHIDNIENGDGTIQYMRGPVKLMDRARSKAIQDYSNEAYPTSACVLDLNRCSLVFNDIATLLSAMDSFTNKIKHDQSGCIIDIVRYKNVFQEYVKSPQYADIKLNVLIKGKSHSIVGEVQLLLRTMKEYKDKAHNLYAITRQKEYYQTSVSSILPILLDHDKQLFVAGNLGNVKALCNLMVISNRSEEEIMKVDEESKESILLNICSRRLLKALRFLKNVISTDLFIDRLFFPNRYDATPVQTAIKKRNNDLMIHYIFGVDEIKQRFAYQNDKETFWRLISALFKGGTSDIIDFVMTEMHITKEQIMEMMVHKRPEYADGNKYHQMNILNKAVQLNTVEGIHKLMSIIGEKAFCELVFNADGRDVNAVENAVAFNKLDIIKYLLSFDPIKNTYANQQRLKWRLLYKAFVSVSASDDMVDLVLSELKLSNEVIIQLMGYKYQKTAEEFPSGRDYHRKTIMSQLVRMNDASRLRKVVSIIGEKAFIEHLFIANSDNMNGLEYCIRKKKTKTMEYLVSFDGIRDKCSNDMETQFRMVWWMNEKYDKSMCDCIVNALKLEVAQLKELQSFKCPKPKDGQYGEKAATYWNKTIPDNAILKIMSHQTK
eukprot:980164_1